MAKKPFTRGRGRLREEAEAQVARDPPEARPRQPVSPLLHELQVHQVELEMQNEELRRDQVELEAAHARYVDLYDFAPIGYVTLSAQGVVEEANLTGAVLLGVERRALKGSPFSRFVGREDADRWHLFLAALVRHESSPHLLDLQLRRADDSVFDARLVCHRQVDGAKVSEIRIVLTDVSESRRLDRALRATKERLSFVIDGSNDGFWDWDVPSGRVTFSRRWASMLGYDLAELEPQVSTWEGMVHAQDLEGARASIAAHLRGETDHFQCELRARHKDGRWIWILDRGKVVERDADGRPLRMAGTRTDVTDRKLSEQERVALQARMVLGARLAAMGSLVTGVAHEINNPLTATLAGQGLALEMARIARDFRQKGEELGERAEAHVLDEMIEALEGAQEGGKRVAQIVRDLAAFGRPQPGRARVKPIDLVGQAMRWWSPSAGQPATVRVENHGAPDVIASAGQIEQVIVHLLSNAAKATPVGREGEIVVRVETGGNGMASIGVIDHGVGIPPEVLGRVFDPFFTTCPVGEGKGVGLGLSISHSIVTAHGGSLLVESEVGKGSTFRVELPAAPDEA